MFGNLVIGQLEIGFVSIVLKSTAFHFMGTVTVGIEKVCRHIATFFVFLPPDSKNIFPPFEKGPEQGYFCLKIFHLFVETMIL